MPVFNCTAGKCDTEMTQSHDEVRDLFVRGLSLLSINLPKERLAALLGYYEILCTWSRKISLVGKRQTPMQIVENHFLDSLLLLKVLPEEGASLVDVGTGAGFPGLACKVAWPETKTLLIEPRLKRVSFLKHVARQLGLENLDIRASRLRMRVSSLMASTLPAGRLPNWMCFLLWSQTLQENEQKSFA